ncbi:MAG TPA: hypothetical protein DIT32_00390 [Peptococcaceae bacterium]|nr:hypothetical protein [Peptococcaceae bacterium]
MKKWLYAGSALLILQFILVVVFNVTSQDFAAFTPEEKLLGFDPHAVDGISVSGEGAQKVVLAKVNGKWQLPDKLKAPADEKKVSEILKKLSALKQGLAVATTRSAAKRFKVSDENFVRHVVLSSGEETVADFFLGTTPSFKKIHARVHDRNEIVSVDLSAYELEITANGWLDRSVLKIEKEKIESLKIGDMALEKQNGAWRLADLADSEEMNAPEVDKLLDKASDLTIEDVLDPSGNEELLKNDPELFISFALAGKERSYSFYKPEKENHYILKSSDHDFLFKIGGWQVDEMKKITRNSLVNVKKENEIPEPGKNVTEGDKENLHQ